MIPSEEFLAISENRPDKRVAARLSVRLIQGRRSILKEYSVNLSVGGLFLESEILLPEKTPLAIEFELPDSRYIYCSARVAWVNDPQHLICENLPPGMGIQFIDLNNEDMEALREFVKNKLIFPTW